MTLIENPFITMEDNYNPLIPTATKEIYSFIEDYLARRDKVVTLRASSANLCVKRRWFTNNGYEGEKLTPRKMVNFLLGDLSERVMVYFVLQSCVGEGKLYSEVDFGEVIGAIEFQGKSLNLYKQKTLTTQYKDEDGELFIPGHADGFGKRNSDNKWELIEFKSSSDYGFDSFIKDGPGNYLNQAHVLMDSNEANAREISEVRFFYLKKQTGHLWDRLEKYDPLISQLVAKEFKESISPQMPQDPYSLKKEVKNKKETGRFIAAFPCNYCDMLKHCKGEYDIEWSKSSFSQKPKYIFKETTK